MNRSRRRLVLALATSVASAAGLLPALPAAAAAPSCGSGPATTSLDLNGDGFDDAAVGDPYATVAGRAEAGAVTILFGDADGRIGEGARRLVTQADLGETPEAGDHFGADVDLARANTSQNCAHLLIGAPGEDLAGGANAGVAHLVGYFTDEAGNPPRLTSQTVNQTDAGGAVEAADAFGSRVVIAGTPEDEPRKLIIAAPGETVGAAAAAGAVNVYRDVAGRSLQLYQGKLLPGGLRVPGTAEAGDRFGAALAAGALSLGGWSAGLVVGAPGDTVAGRDGAGSVTVLREGEDWIDRAVLLTQDTPGVPGGAETGDEFGYSVALSPRDGLEPRTLAVGAPREDAGTLADAGSVTLFTNTDGRMAPWTAFSQDTVGVPGRNEAGDRFGHALVFGFNTPTLHVGVPTEDVGSVADAGAVQPVLVEGRSTPLTFPTSVTESTGGTPGTLAPGNRFGNALAALFGQHENLMTAASVYAGVGSVWVLSDAVAENSARGWVPGQGGIPATGAGRFGWSVTN